MKISEILKPCPFCGAEIIEARIDMDMAGVTYLEVNCHCGAEVRLFSTERLYSADGRSVMVEPSAIDKWNRRDGNASQNEAMEG